MRATLGEQLRAQIAQTGAEVPRLRLTDLRYRAGAQSAVYPIAQTAAIHPRTLELHQENASMLRNAHDLQSYTVEASDGTAGRLRGFCSDDLARVIRHLVGDAGSWLPGRKVQASPLWFTVPDGASRAHSANRRREQVKDSPDIDNDRAAAPA